MARSTSLTRHTNTDLRNTNSSPPLHRGTTYGSDTRRRHAAGTHTSAPRDPLVSATQQQTSQSSSLGGGGPQGWIIFCKTKGGARLVRTRARRSRGGSRGRKRARLRLRALRLGTCCACLQATEFYSANRLVLGNREEHAQRVHPAVERVGVSVLVDRPLTATNHRQQPSAKGAGARKKAARDRRSGGRTIWWCPHAPCQRTSPEDVPAGSGPRTAPARSSRARADNAAAHDRQRDFAGVSFSGLRADLRG